MELSSAVFRDVLGPIAAFKDISRAKKNVIGSKGGEPNGGSHESRQPSSPQTSPALETISPNLASHNHQAPISEPIPNYKWTIQGADPTARRFFAIPQFAFNSPPLRIDVYLPPLEEYDDEVKRLLKPEEVIYTSRDQIPQLTFSRWLERVLERWAVGYDDGNKGKFEREYGSLPFGSRVLVTVGGLIGSGGGGEIDTEVYLLPEYDVEQGMLSVEDLKGMWKGLGHTVSGGGDKERSGWPEIIDLEELRLKRQFHEAISIVTIPITGDTKEWVFKSLTRDQRYLYNELKMFLTLQPHENIIRR